jgi:hypothetical protein
MIHKHVLVTNRVRQPPRAGFSWVDRRFVHQFAPQLSPKAILLYFFLASVSDKQGLSYYRDDSMGSRLRIRQADLLEARDELVRHDLVAYESPLTQVLSLPGAQRRQQSGLHALGEIFRQARRDHKDQ